MATSESWHKTPEGIIIRIGKTNLEGDRNVSWNQTEEKWLNLMRNNIIFKTKFHNFLQNKISQFPTNMECGMDPTIEAFIRKLRSATTLFKKRTMAQVLSYEFCVNTTFVLSQQTFVSVKTYWRRLEDVFSVTFFCLPRRLEDIHNCKTSCKHVLKTSSWRHLARLLPRRLDNVLGRLIANTSWRRLEDLLGSKKCLLGWYCC